MNWDLEDLRMNVLKIHGKSALFKISPCLDSIVERQEFAHYHFNEAKNLLNSYMDSSYPDMELFRLIFSADDHNKEEFKDKRFQARAHVVGCIQSIHSVSDILSHVVYYALNLSQAKNERDINVFNVIRWLGTDIKFEIIKKGLIELTDHQDYKYLVALTNHSKHRSIVSLIFNFNLRKPNQGMKELVFPQFSYGRKNFHKKSVFEFLEAEFYRQSRAIIEIGNEINRITREWI